MTRTLCIVPMSKKNKFIKFRGQCPASSKITIDYQLHNFGCLEHDYNRTIRGWDISYSNTNLTFPLDTVNLCFSVSVKDEASHRYKTTYTPVVLYVLFSVILDRNRRDENILKLKVENIPRTHSVLNLFLNIILECYYCYQCVNRIIFLWIYVYT
jgi:hypothetical protein